MRARLVVGADGVQSAVRASLFGAAKPEFCGITAWRGVVPMEQVPPSISRTIGTNWVGPGGHVVHYPLRAGKLLNFVGMGERTDWTGEGWNVRGTTEEVLNDFRGWNPDIHAIIRNIDVPYKWALALRPTMDSWTKGRCTLLGDACHSMVPFLAQGAVMALEDGLVLARCAGEARRLRHGLRALRSGAPRARQQGGAGLRRHDPALPQPFDGRRRAGRGARLARMAAGRDPPALRLAVHLRRDQQWRCELIRPAKRAEGTARLAVGAGLRKACHVRLLRPAHSRP